MWGGNGESDESFYGDNRIHQNNPLLSKHLKLLISREILLPRYFLIKEANAKMLSRTNSFPPATPGRNRHTGKIPNGPMLATQPKLNTPHPPVFHEPSGHPQASGRIGFVPNFSFLGPFALLSSIMNYTDQFTS